MEKNLKDICINSGIKFNNITGKIDIGTSWDAAESQNWIANDNGVMIFAFEPNPEFVNFITNSEEKRDRSFHGYNHSKKELDSCHVNKRFFIIPVALDDIPSPTTMKLYIPDAHGHYGACGSLLQDRTLGGTKCTYDVQVFRLTDFFDLLPIDTHNVIDYIKIDAQGRDINILQSAKNYLSENVVYVTAEPEAYQYHGAENNTLINMVEYMTSIGFLHWTNHPNTTDPTFLNKKFLNKKDVYIYQKD